MIGQRLPTADEPDCFITGFSTPTGIGSKGMSSRLFGLPPPATCATVPGTRPRVGDVSQKRCHCNRFPQMGCCSNQPRNRASRALRPRQTSTGSPRARLNSQPAVLSGYGDRGLRTGAHLPPVPPQTPRPAPPASAPPATRQESPQPAWKGWFAPNAIATSPSSSPTPRPTTLRLTGSSWRG
jgi:hypothetical protein